MKKVLLFISFCFLVLSFNAQEINWITFEELPVKMREKKKPVVIFVYTDWCKYCKMQESITFTNDSVINKLNNYYAIKFNAETTASVVFLGKTYKFVSIGLNTGEHELAIFLTNQNGSNVYPSTIVFDDKFQLKKSMFGYQSAQKIKQL